MEFCFFEIEIWYDSLGLHKISMLLVLFKNVNSVVHCAIKTNCPECDYLSL